MAYQKFPDSRQLEKEINSGKLENAYLFLGEEEGDKEKFIDKIIHKTFKTEEDKKYSFGRFHVEYGELSDACEFALSGSIFAGTRIILILNINNIKQKGEDIKLFTELLDDIIDSNIIIMTSPENKVPSAVNAGHAKNIKIIQFWKHFESDISVYIIKSLKQNSIEIHREAMALLMDFTGREIKKVDQALQKIIDSGEKSVTIDIIRYLIPDEKEVSVFEFIDMLFQKKKDAFKYLSKVLDAGNHELAVLKMIMREAELIEKYHALAGKKTVDDALKEIGISQRNSRTFMESAGKYSNTGIKKIFPLIYKTDYRLKSANYSGNLSSNPLFELVAEMIMANN